MEIKIRSEEANDIEPVREILCAAFSSDAESKLVDALRANNKAIISLVAFHEDQVLGHSCSPWSLLPRPARRRELDWRLSRSIQISRRRGLAQNSLLWP